MLHFALVCEIYKKIASCICVTASTRKVRLSLWSGYPNLTIKAQKLSEL